MDSSERQNLNFRKNNLSQMVSNGFKWFQMVSNGFRISIVFGRKWFSLSKIVCCLMTLPWQGRQSRQGRAGPRPSGTAAGTRKTGLALARPPSDVPFTPLCRVPAAGQRREPAPGLLCSPHAIGGGAACAQRR